ncbi:MAG: AraC family transcriptional regulator [Hyphomonadaceae bacterium]
MTPLQFYWALFAGGIGCFLVAGLIGGPISTLLELAGAGTCGLSWLLVRALFRPDAVHAIWPRAVVGALFITAILSDVLAGLASGNDAFALLRRGVQNVHALTSSTVLLLALVDAFDGFRAAPRSEQRFRLLFAGSYGALVLVSVILLGQNGLGAFSTALVQQISAILALIGATAAVAYRLREPLPVEAARKRRTPIAADTALAAKIRRLIEVEHIYTRAEIKVADLAHLTGEPDYRVTQCITGALGFANFNRLINHHRIARAKQMLADPTLRDRPILVIALECGFGSIGPFNRAFKEAVGATPRAFRKAAAKHV